MYGIGYPSITTTEYVTGPTYVPGTTFVTGGVGYPAYGTSVVTTGMPSYVMPAPMYGTMGVMPPPVFTTSLSMAPSVVTEVDVVTTGYPVGGFIQETIY